MAQTLVAGACSWDSLPPLMGVGRTWTELGYKPQGDRLPPGRLYLLKVTQSFKTAPPTGVGSGRVQTHVEIFGIQTKTGLEVLKLPVMTQGAVSLSGLSPAIRALS